jgi:thiol-disulfide isomerase/thioredoxin
MVTLHVAFAAMVLAGTNQTVMLDFYTDWCGSCKTMNPTVERLQKAGYPVQRVNAEKDKALAAKYGITGYPTFVMLVDGKEVDRVVGGTTDYRLEQMCKRGAAAKAIGQSPPMLALQGPAASQSVPPSLPGGSPAWEAHGSQSAALQQTATASGPTDSTLIAATVRLRVKDPNGTSCGSGTIIDARGGEAMILTCGHIFRDSQGKGRIQITVDLFGQSSPQQVLGEMYHYDIERDVGLVRIHTPGPVAVARVAPPGYRVARGTPVVSVGCNNGDSPTARHSQVTALEKFVGPTNLSGPSNVEVAGEPVEGRSGGGLFSNEGYLIGVCNAADPSDKEGVFAALGLIYAELDRTKLSFVYQSPGTTPGVSPEVSTDIQLANATSPIAKPMAGAVDSAAMASAAVPATGASSGLPLQEQAALDEIRRRTKEGADIVLVIRPRDNPNAKSEVLMLDHASPEFVRLITADARPQGKPFPTSLNLPGPRKVLLEWSKQDSKSSDSDWKPEGTATSVATSPVLR